MLTFYNYLTMTNKYLISLLTSIALSSSISPVWGQKNTTPDITFACEYNQGIPITVAKNKVGRSQTIFYWKEEILKDRTSKTPKELCTDISKKLTDYIDDYLVKDNETFSFELIATHEAVFPTICITTSSSCNFVLFTLTPVGEPQIAALETLGAIINTDRPYKDLNPGDAVVYGYQIDLFNGK